MPQLHWETHHLTIRGLPGGEACCPSLPCPALPAARLATAPVAPEYERGLPLT